MHCSFACGCHCFDDMSVGAQHAGDAAFALPQLYAVCAHALCASTPSERILPHVQEWEYSHKKGFKSTFERGILHLYFNFKRARYRR